MFPSIVPPSGLTVQQMHAEGGGGQFELAVAHTDAFAAADALVLQREAVVDTAAQRGRPASFLPKLWHDRSASGSHIHFSIWKVWCTLSWCAAHSCTASHIWPELKDIHHCRMTQT